MAIGDLFRSSAIYNHPNADGDVVNIFDYVQDEEVSVLSQSAICQEIANAVGALLETEIMASLEEEWVLNRVECFGISDPTASATYVSNTAGTQTGETLPIRSAPVMTKITGLRGRTYRGRTFWPAPGEASQDGGVLLQAWVDVFADAGEELRLYEGDQMNVYQMVVYSAKLEIGTRVSNVIVRSTLGSIRGRQAVS